MTDLRIPRPKGVTIKAKEGNTKEVYNLCSEAFTRGLFPYNHQELSIYKFASLYNIPEQVIEAHIKDGLAHSLISDDGDLVQTIEQERLKLFSSSLFRLGNSDRQLNSLLAYLANRVLNNPTAHPLLLKEMNSSLNTQVKLTETSLKAITMLNEALVAHAQQTGVEEITDEALTREQVLKELEEIKISPQLLESHLADVPNIHPMGEAKGTRANLHPGTDSYVKHPETTVPAKLVEAVSLPT